MDDTAWLVLSLVGVVCAAWAWQWYRRRRAATWADRLLADVLRDKDGFRR